MLILMIPDFFSQRESHEYHHNLTKGSNSTVISAKIWEIHLFVRFGAFVASPKEWIRIPAYSVL